MALTVAFLKEIGKHSLHGGDPAAVFTSAAVTLVQRINEAGRYLYGMRPWHAFQRVPVTLDFTIAVNYVAFPTNFSRVIAWSGTDSLRDFALTSLDEILKLRVATTPVVGSTLGAIVHPTQTSDTTVPPVPRLELWPTPAASVAAALTFIVQPLWTELPNTDAKVANVPLAFESLLEQLVRAFTAGNEHQDLAQRLIEVQAGPIYANLVALDETEQPDYGVPVNGALATGVLDPMYYQNSYVPNP